MNTNQAMAEIKAANNEGRRANMCGANLRGADLYAAYLTGANLRGADLYAAYLTGANLYGASLQGANLYGANLQGANLQEADLYRADLSRANLYGANLRGANLREANLYGASLQGANLYGANLYGANLQDASLGGAKGLDPLVAASLFVPPQSGAFTAYKKCRDGVVVTLEIPADSKRSSATTRKCRAEKAVVTAISDGSNEAISMHDRNFIYRLGETAECDSWEDDRWVECGGGIHFYLTREEAEAHR